MFGIARAALLAAAFACAAVWAASAATVIFFDDVEADANSYDVAPARGNVAEGLIDMIGRGAEEPSFSVGSSGSPVDFAGFAWTDREDGLRQFLTFSTTVIPPEEQAATFFAAFGGDRKDPIVDDARLFQPLAHRLARSAPAAASLAAAPVSGSLLFLVTALIGLVALQRKR